jgi:Flp pilus assembly protein TadG
MRANNQSGGRPRRANHKQKGAAHVEFALVVLIYFTFVIGIMELARAMYICNTLQEVTRRAAAAAAKTDFSDANALSQVRVKSIFRDGPGMLAFADPITDAHIRIDYMYVEHSGATLQASPITAMPASPARNRVNCATDPYGASCIRLVRVRVCDTAGTAGACGAVPYKAMVPLIPMPFTLPISTTITPVESLGG